MEQPFHDHGEAPVGLDGAFRGDEAVESQAPGHGEQGLDMGVGDGASMETVSSGQPKHWPLSTRRKLSTFS